jgi:hypothetical protein
MVKMASNPAAGEASDTKKLVALLDAVAVSRPAGCARPASVWII